MTLSIAVRRYASGLPSISSMFAVSERMKMSMISSLLLFFLCHRRLDDLVNDVQCSLITNDARKGMWRHDRILVELIVLSTLLCSLSATSAPTFLSSHNKSPPRHSMTGRASTITFGCQTVPRGSDERGQPCSNLILKLNQIVVVINKKIR